MDVVIEQSLIGDEADAEISSWSVDDGALVEKDQPLAELETSKVVVQLVAPASGTLQILVEAGEVVEAGAVVARIS